MTKDGVDSSTPTEPGSTCRPQPSWQRDAGEGPDGDAVVPATTVYIAGSGHSGSTLLDLMLGGHPLISALGEVHRLFLSTQMTGTPYLCECGQHVLSCPFWSSTIQELGRLLGDTAPDLLTRYPTTDPAHLDRVSDDDPVWMIPPDLKPLPELNPSLDRLAMVAGSRRLWSMLERTSASVRTQRTAIRNSVLLFEAVRRAHGTPVIVDSTKNPARLKGLYLETRGRFLVVHLVRDGRAVAYSRMSRDGIPMERCARAWRIEQIKRSSIMWNIPSSLVTRIHYEDLCLDPRRVLTDLSDWLGLAFDERMLDIGSPNRHGLGGNPMRYQRAGGQVRLDERWRREMSSADLHTFERIAGRLNRRLGYR